MTRTVRSGIRGRKDLKPDELEFYESSAFSITARNSRDRIEVCKSMHSQGVGVRAVLNGAIGFSFYSRESEKEDAIKRAVKSAKLSPNERYSFPVKAKYEKVKQCDPKLKKLGEEDVVGLLIETINGASEKAEPSQGEISVTSSLTRITSSTGLDAQQEDTVLSAFVSAKKKEAIGYDYIDRKNLDADFTQLGRNAGDWACRSAGGKPIDFSGPIVLSLEGVQNFFESCVMRNLNGENARRSTSIWKLGQQVMSPCVTLLDDPTRPWASGTLSVDDEGVPAKSKLLIENGVVKRFLYNTRTANLVKTCSTGNGFRAGFVGLPSISSTNLVLSSSERTDVMDAREGVFVKDLMGFHNMNPITGDFSLDITQGFTVKNGKLDRPVTGCMLIGNFFEVLRGPLEFDEEERGKSSFFSPRIRFDGRVVSK